MKINSSMLKYNSKILGRKDEYPHKTTLILMKFLFLHSVYIYKCKSL